MTIKMAEMEKNLNIDEWNLVGDKCLPGHMGIKILSLNPDELSLQMEVSEKLLAPNGFLHAASVIAIADTACGYGTMVNLPEGALGFTTIELKSNFIGTLRKGTLGCKAKPVHKGKTTQVWDAEVFIDETGKKIAFFRCTQFLLWPKKDS